MLEIYFTGKADLEKAVKMAGYKTRSKSMRYYVGSKIVEKLENGARGKEIFRRVGLGEVTIAMLLLQIARDAKSGSNARISALNVASKCVGLQKEVIEGGEGADIVINYSTPGKPGAQQPQAQRPDKAKTKAPSELAIVK